MPLIRRQPPADLDQVPFGTLADKEREELLMGYDDVEEWARQGPSNSRHT